MTSSYGMSVFVPRVFPSVGSMKVSVYFCLSNLILRFVELAVCPAPAADQLVPLLLIETALKPSYFSVIVNVPPEAEVTVFVGVVGQLPSIFCL